MKRSSSSAPPPTARILIVDDHAIVREGLVDIIGRESGLEICGQTGDGFAALALSEKIKPDLVLLDLSLTGKSGIELIKDFHVQQPDVSVLVLSMHDETLYAERVLRAGGRGYVMKMEGGQRLVAAIRQVLAGEVAVSPKIAAKLLNTFTGSPSDASPIACLTDRELEIFQLIGRGLNSVAIGQHLHISARTADIHRAHIRDKLRITTSAELIAFAARWSE